MWTRWVTDCCLKSLCQSVHFAFPRHCVVWLQLWRRAATFPLFSFGLSPGRWADSEHGEDACKLVLEVTDDAEDQDQDEDDGEDELRLHRDVDEEALRGAADPITNHLHGLDDRLGCE